MNNNLTLTRAQSGALARLIRSHLNAYEEATGAGKSRKPAKPFTGRDLDLLEPLVVLLEKSQTKSPIC